MQPRGASECADLRHWRGQWPLFQAPSPPHLLGNLFCTGLVHFSGIQVYLCLENNFLGNNHLTLVNPLCVSILYLKNYHLYGCLFSLALPHLALITWKMVYLLPRKWPPLQTSVGWERWRENVVVAAKWSVSLYLLLGSAGSREPSEGTYAGHFPGCPSDYALSRCLRLDSWWYGRVLLVNIRCGKSLSRRPHSLLQWLSSFCLFLQNSGLLSLSAVPGSLGFPPWVPAVCGSNYLRALREDWPILLINPVTPSWLLCSR